MTKLRLEKIALIVAAFCLGTAAASSAQTFTSLASFNSPNGSYPSGALVQGFDGNLYGTTENNAVFYEGGTVFVMTPAGAITTLHNLSISDGGIPTALVLNGNGTFFGTACCGTTSNWGAAFSIGARGKFNVLYSYDSASGSPNSALLAANGEYYGTTLNGGTTDSGTVFEMTPAGARTTLYNFCTQPNCADSGDPGSLIQASDGNFYGTSIGGVSASPYGTVFQLTPAGTLTTVYSFCAQSGCSDGFWPFGLVQAEDGDLYGTTEFGGLTYTLCWFNGPSGCGTIFKISPTGTFTSLYVFCTQGGNSCPDEGLPVGPMIQATDGNFYGTTSGLQNVICQPTSTSGCGTIFKMTPGGQLTTLHTFDRTDGWEPGALVQATDGNFYGTTSDGGANDSGTAFKLSMGLGPFVKLVPRSGHVGQTGAILGQGFTGTSSVSVNGTPSSFIVVSDTLIQATVPAGATTGFVTVDTPSGTLKSNLVFRVLP
jgi:uncharacterized repeat protein (TIGR03803 family)